MIARQLKHHRTPTPFLAPTQGARQNPEIFKRAPCYIDAHGVTARPTGRPLGRVAHRFRACRFNWNGF